MLNSNDFFQFVNTKQFVFRFEFKQIDSNVSSTVYAWYDFLHRLYFHWNFVLLGAKLQDCGIGFGQFRLCQCTATFVNATERYESVNDVPVSGIGLSSSSYISI